MKKIASFITVLGCASLIIGCQPKKDNEAPVADTETESAVEASWATYVISDIDQVFGFIGEDRLLQHFYMNTANGGTVTVVRDLDAKQLVIGWNNTLCLDGRTRDGSIFMYYKKDPISNPDANENSRYYRDFGFVGRIQLSNYKVDGWLITLYDPAAPAYVYNKLTTDAYNPSVTKLTWLIAGKFLLSHPSDPSKNIVWDGKLTKTLTNSNDPLIFNPSKQVSIDWANRTKPGKNAIVSYSGKISGFTSNNTPFTMEIDPRTPLIRDFGCSSDPVSSVSLQDDRVNMNLEEHHPFINGIASFTPANKYPRQIYYGNEGEPSLAQQCDNEGIVQIQGNSYKVNFRK